MHRVYNTRRVENKIYWIFVLYLMLKTNIWYLCSGNWNTFYKKIVTEQVITLTLKGIHWQAVSFIFKVKSLISTKNVKAHIIVKCHIFYLNHSKTGNVYSRKKKLILLTWVLSSISIALHLIWPKSGFTRISRYTFPKKKNIPLRSITNPNCFDTCCVCEELKQTSHITNPMVSFGSN